MNLRNLAGQQAKRYLVAGILFLFFLPLYLIWFRPHNDIQYHLSGGEPQQFDKITIRKSLKNNIYARVRGKIIPDSIAVYNAGNFILPEYSFVFRLKGYPENFALHLKSGPLYERLNGYYKKLADGDRAKLLREFAGRTANGTLSFEGRLYSSWHILFPFENYQYEDDAEVSGYFDDLVDKRKQSPDDLYLMAVGETPSPDNLADTRVPVFATGIVLGIAGIFFFLFRKSGNSGAAQYFEKANRYMMKGDFTKASPLLAKAFSLDPEDESIKKAYASVLSVTGEPERALELYNSMLEIDSANPGLLGDKANTLEIMGQSAEALEVYDRIQELCPQDPDLYFNKGTSLERAHLYEEALRFYNSIINDHPDYPSAYYNKACLLNARMHRRAEAGEALLKAIELQPSYAEEVKVDDDLRGLLNDKDGIL